jgi:hypothetical protein
VEQPGRTQFVKFSAINLTFESPENQGLQEPEIYKAYLHPPIYAGRYQVEFDGALIVQDSHDPETDLARALLSRGMTGTVKVIDAKTGKHRSTVDTAKLRTEEGPHGPRFVRFKQTVVEPPHAGETNLPASPVAERDLKSRNFFVQI